MHAFLTRCPDGESKAFYPPQSLRAAGVFPPVLRWIKGRQTNGKDAQKGRSAAENLRGLWVADGLAQEMGKGLGRGAVLL